MIATYDIQEIVKQITQFYHPEKLILFGSAATDTMNENSDVDLIVVKQTTEPKHKRSASIYKHLMALKTPLDIVVYTPKEYDEDVKNPYSFLHNALINSKVMYEQ